MRHRATRSRRRRRHQHRHHPLQSPPRSHPPPHRPHGTLPPRRPLPARLQQGQNRRPHLLVPAGHQGRNHRHPRPNGPQWRRPPHWRRTLRRPHTLAIDHGSTSERISAQNILIGVGTAPARPANIPFDERNVVDADGILRIPRLPRSLTVVGGGVIGTEYASMMQALGVKVTLVENRPRLLEFLDPEIAEALQYHLRQAGMTLRLGEKVTKVEIVDAPPGSSSDAG
ncbi:MAG: FAD-dependent oxidoreductase, partial [Deltaproteobacteria bacterium]|nr:FAD-dependent oxidoreductase [Deltaproteobacteria bacterium]